MTSIEAIALKKQQKLISLSRVRIIQCIASNYIYEILSSELLTAVKST